jgi:phosphoribosylaminoimidazole-succinocarboxamide synthase
MTRDVGSPLIQTSIPGLPMRRGKVRDVYDLGEEILLVATDRLSAFDVVLPTPIPGKGEVLTRLSQFWFRFFERTVPHHLIEVIDDRAPSGLEEYLPILRGRTMRCRKAQVVPIECVVRGYLAGSGWKEYQRTGAIGGCHLPPGLKPCDRLPEPIFTPASKVEQGHDETIIFAEACRAVGEVCMKRLRERSLMLYEKASAHAADRGILLADTKFEWGFRDGDYLLIDEVLTPDSSRFWPTDRYEPGRDQESFDKQFVRNYLQTLVDAGRWDQAPPGPELPAEVVVQTALRYQEALRRLTA